MKIAFNVLPLKTGHKTRGIGFYTKNLLENLKKTDLEIQEFENISEVKDVDVVHYPWFDLFFRSLHLNKKIPSVVTVHDVIPLLFPKNYPLGLKTKINFYFQKRALKSCQRIITDSQCSKKDIIKLLKINSDKIIVIPLAANLDFKLLNDAKLLSVKRKYNLPDYFILYVGDVNFVKNLPFLIEGFKTLKKDPAFWNIKLILVNGVFLKKVENIDHPELKSLKQVNRMIVDYKLEDEILRPGQLDSADLAGFYNLATLYVQPSLYEGFGLPLLEAMSCGTPVISSNSSSLPEIGGNAPVYFDPVNLEQFVRVLSLVLQSKSIQDKLSKLGLMQAKKFSWEKVAYETIRVYKEVLVVN